MQLSPLTSSRNLAARMGRWSANHHKIAIFGWLAFVIAAIAIGTAVGQKTIDPHAYTAGEAHRGEQILKQAGFAQAGRLTEIVAIQSTSLTIADPPSRRSSPTSPTPWRRSRPSTPALPPRHR